MIEKCPVCEKSQCESTRDAFKLWRITCGNCGYRSNSHMIESIVIERHNHISQCVRAFEGVDVGKCPTVKELVERVLIMTNTLSEEHAKLKSCIKDGE